MRCWRCQGTGNLAWCGNKSPITGDCIIGCNAPAYCTRRIPCPDCIGGTASCCEVTDDPEAREEGDHD